MNTVDFQRSPIKLQSFHGELQSHFLSLEIDIDNSHPMVE